MIHALYADKERAVCVYFFKRTRLPDNHRTSTRVELINCPTCQKLLAKHGQLKNWLWLISQTEGELGTLDRQAGNEEAKRYWKERQKEGGKVPAWARALYLAQEECKAVWQGSGSLKEEAQKTFPSAQAPEDPGKPE